MIIRTARLGSAIAALLVGAGAAHAQTSTLNVSGTVPPLCVTGMLGAWGLALDEVADPADGLYSGPTFVLGSDLMDDAGGAGQDAWCNGVGAVIEYEVEPLLNTTFAGVVPEGFTDRIHLQSRLTLGGADLTYSTDQGDIGPMTSATVGVFAGRMGGYLSITALGLRPIAGEYRGEIRLNLRANP